MIIFMIVTHTVHTLKFHHNIYFLFNSLRVLDQSRWLFYGYFLVAIFVDASGDLRDSVHESRALNLSVCDLQRNVEKVPLANFICT